MPLLVLLYYYWIVQSTQDEWNGFEVASFGFKEDDSEHGNDASEDCRIRQLVIGFE
jgi:hypothetical protein